MFRSPFRPVKITLGSGRTCIVRHPEGIGFTSEWAIVEESDGPLLFELTEVESVQTLRNGKPRKR